MAAGVGGSSDAVQKVKYLISNAITTADTVAIIETALRGVIIGDRFPKSGCEVVITILEGEEDAFWGDRQGGERSGGWSMMSALAGCITVASAALVDAGIDCVDLVSGGVAALVKNGEPGTEQVVLDPAPVEHNLKAACVVGYLQSRDEIYFCRTNMYRSNLKPRRLQQSQFLLEWRIGPMG